MSPRLFQEILSRHLVSDRLGFVVDGQMLEAGPPETGHRVVLEVHRKRLFGRILRHGSLGLAEAYMDGDYTIQEGHLYLFLEILLRNRLHRGRNFPWRSHATVRFFIAWQRLREAAAGKTRNVRHHYDIGNDLFELFLDKSLTYSCGYAHTPQDDIETLQRQKMARICRKLRLKEDESLVDLGCGFGGLLIYAAKTYKITGVGATLSRNQAEKAQQRVFEAGLAEKIKIHVADYGAIEGKFDKFANVGVMEHIPDSEYRHFFQRARALLKPEGLGLLHTICLNRKPQAGGDRDLFLQKYIFPGYSLPTLSGIAGHLEALYMPILDVENIVRHYTLTLLRWHEGFQARQHELDPQKYDDRFKRMWSFYLLACAAGMKLADLAVLQVLFNTDCRAEMPLHRI